MKQIQVGLVGFGLSGRFLQAPFFEALPHFNLKSIVTSRPIPTDVFPTSESAYSIDSLLEDAEIELIAICTPNSTHFDLTKKCLEAGKHVLVEKPVTATKAEAAELYALAKSKGLTLCVYQNRRFDSDFLTCMKIVRGGFLGEIHSYNAHFNRFKPELNPKQWKEEADPSNGILYDLGAHLIDQAIFLFGKPQSFSGEVFTQRKGSTVDDAFYVQLNYEKLKVRLQSSLLIAAAGPKFEIHGTVGSFHKHGMDVQEDHLKAGMSPSDEHFGLETAIDFGTLTTTLNGVAMNAKITTDQGNWKLLYINLYEAIRNGKELFIKEDEILSQMEILESVKKS